MSLLAIGKIFADDQRWIFILEGIVTVVAGVASFWIMCDYPATAKFLTAPEKEAVKARLALDNDGCSQEYKTKFIKDAFLDWKIWVAAIMFQGALMPVYCFSLFSPTLTANLGYTAATAQLMSVPPYIVAAFTTVGAGYWSDRVQKRGMVVITFATLGLIGFIMLVSNQIHAVNYAGLFLSAAGVYPLIPVVVSWGTNNCGGSLKKGVGAAIIVSVGNAGGIISSFIYPSTDKPKYTKGHAICSAYLGFTIVLAFIMSRYYDAQNKRKDERNAARGGQMSAEEKESYKDDGDKVDWFRYTI
jgi:sugar phosphate permease